MPRYPAGYIRKSVVTSDRPGDATREVQLQSIERLAPGARVFEDWGLSGNGRSTGRRTAYLKLKSEVKAGRISVVAAYKLDRLGRSVREAYDFIELCIAHDTAVLTLMDNIDVTTASGRAQFGNMAIWAQLESDLASERTKAALHAMREKGSRLGITPIGFRAEKDPVTKVRTFVPDGSADAIVQAYRDAGTLTGACHLLAERGIKTPRGKDAFSMIGLRAILERCAPDLLPPRRPSGIRRRNKHVLSGLFVCSKDGRVMTPDAFHRSLYCSSGRAQGALVHGKATIPYSLVMPLVEAEAAKYMPSVVVTYQDETTVQRRAISERKGRVGEMYEAGVIGQTEFKAKVAALDAELLALGDRDSAIEALELEPSGVDFTAEPSEVNAKLHQLFSKITVEPGYQTLRFDWKLPAHMHDPVALAAYEAELQLAEAS